MSAARVALVEEIDHPVTNVRRSLRIPSRRGARYRDNMPLSENSLPGASHAARPPIIRLLFLMVFERLRQGFHDCCRPQDPFFRRHGANAVSARLKDR